MKKYLQSILILSAALAIFASCQKEELAQSQPANKTTEEVNVKDGRLISYSVFKSTPASEAISKCSFLDSGNPQDSSFAEIFKASIFGRDIIDFEIVTYTIKYLSSARDVNGEQNAEFYGSVSFLVDRTGLISNRKLESVSLCNTIFNTSAADVVAFQEYFNLRALHNALAVFPYYQGGSVNDKFVAAPAEFLYKGKQAIDCELAALELIKHLDGVEMKDDYYTESIGISNGGGAALAIHYLLENDKHYKNHAKEINLYSTYIGEGNLNNTALFPNLLKKYEYTEASTYDLNALAPVGYLAIVAGTYMTWQDKYFEGIKLEDYFSEKYLSYKSPVTGKNPLEQFLTNDGTLMYEAFTDPSGLSIFDAVNPNLLVYDAENDSYSFNTEEGSIINNVFEAFKENECILSGWSPKTPMKITHSLADEFIYYKTNFKVWKDLSHLGFNTNVQLGTLVLLEHFNATIYEILVDVLLHKHPVEVEDQEENSQMKLF